MDYSIESTMRIERTKEEKEKMRSNRRVSVVGDSQLFNDVINAFGNQENTVSNFHDAEEWEPPVAIDEFIVPPFPDGIFNPTIEKMIDGIAEFTQTPKDIAAMISFGVLSTSLSKKFAIEAKKGWKEPLNTYTVTLMDPSNRKTVIYIAMTKPIYSYEKSLREEMIPQIEKRILERSTLEKRIEKLQNDFAKTSDSHTLGEIREVNEQLKRLPILYTPTFILDNVTPEALIIEIMQNNEKMSILSSEGDLFERFKSGSKDQMKLDVYLKGFSADPLRVDRIVRDTNILDEPLLTVSISAQPSVIYGIPRELHDRGLTGRFIYSIPKDNLGYRVPNPPSISDTVNERYNLFINKLMQFTPKHPVVLKLDEAAREELTRLQWEVEKEFREGGVFQDYLKFWGGKLIGHLLRVTGLLHVAKYAEEYDMDNIPTTVSVETLKLAIELKDYFIAHVQKAFGVMELNQGYSDAKYLLDRILKQNETIIAKQTIHQLSKNKVKSKERFYRAYDILEFHGYIKQVMGGKYGNKAMILVNPFLFTTRETDPNDPKVEQTYESTEKK